MECFLFGSQIVTQFFTSERSLHICLPSLGDSQSHEPRQTTYTVMSAGEKNLPAITTAFFRTASKSYMPFLQIAIKRQSLFVNRNLSAS